MQPASWPKPVLLAFVLCACTPKPDASGSSSTNRPASSNAPLNAEATADPSKIALQALEAWVKAQNENKLDAYLAMYDVASFQGIKRTTSGTEQTFDFKGWKDERSRMFASDVTVAADAPAVTTWNQNPTLGKDVVEVRFTQRWKNPRYADHGPKVLRFKLTTEGPRIIREELVSTSAGWDENTPAPVAGGKKFFRARPAHEDSKSVDACAYLGGAGMACLDALLAEKNPVIKAYMRRLSDADARLAFDRWQAKNPDGVPHAELALQCADNGPCGKTTEKNDDGYACLTRAEAAIQENNEAESKKAHERACMCGAERAQIPIMGGFLACQGKTPERRGQTITTAEANEIRACGECDPEKGPDACVKEIERLSKTDRDLATYLSTVHIPRCSRP